MDLLRPEAQQAVNELELASERGNGEGVRAAQKRLDAYNASRPEPQERAVVAEVSDAKEPDSKGSDKERAAASRAVDGKGNEAPRDRSTHRTAKA